MLRGLSLLSAFPCSALLLLSACSPVQPPPVAAAATTATTAAVRHVAVKKTTVEHLTFQIDAARSHGHIETTLDPHQLGPRSSDCTCPLGGSFAGKLTTRPDGSRSLTLDRITLATTSDAHFDYNWSPLIGSIDSVIPSGKLTISRSSIPAPLTIDPHGAFEQGGNTFTVGGIARVVGRGLILRKQVGEQETDLSIAQTTAVKLAGSLVRRDGLWILHLPAAVMKDRLELDDQGSTMDLHFTAHITAVAQ